MKIISIDAERCLGCRSCELACAVAHSRSKNLEGALRESPYPGYRVSVLGETGTAVPLQCRHCEDAPCVRVCPSGALEKTEGGTVQLDDSLCIGCRLCLIACPFGVIRSDSEGKAVIKCDLCRERLANGEAPACVEACPTRALRFVESETMVREKQLRFLTEYKK